MDLAPLRPVHPLRRRLGAWGTRVLDLLFPPSCLLCREPVANHGGLCLACWSGLEPMPMPACAGCGLPLTQGFGAPDPPPGTRCGACLAEPPRHDGIVAAARYNVVSRGLVMGLKHGHRLMLAPLMARLMVATLGATRIPEPAPDAPWLVIPVPLHRGRLRRRTFNQSVLLAQPIARALGQPLLVDALERRRATPSLGGLGKSARAAALNGAIVAIPRHRARLAGAQVLLVDDVLTSGATARACVDALRAAGASRVRIVCFARVLRA